MKTTKYVLFAALGVAAVLLLTSDAAKEYRDEIEESAKKNAKKWKNKLASVGSSTSDTISDLKDMLSSEITGLSDEARERIEAIVNGAQKSSSKIKKNVSKQLS
jgi:gas vesicle protein